MKYPWDVFFEEKMRKIFTEKRFILDIGGGLRIAPDRGNRHDSKRMWLAPYLSDVEYKVMDPVDTYRPDIVGDIHSIPLEANSVDAIICMAVLEHVEDPLLAMREMHRVLKPGGYLFLYMPFLYYYHAEKGYYKDYWRFTKDALAHMAKSFTSFESVPVRGALGTWMRLSPLGRISLLNPLWYGLDRLGGKLNSRQVSGYNAFLVK